MTAYAASHSANCPIDRLVVFFLIDLMALLTLAAVRGHWHLQERPLAARLETLQAIDCWMRLSSAASPKDSELPSEYSLSSSHLHPQASPHYLYLVAFGVVASRWSSVPVSQDFVAAVFGRKSCAADPL